MSGGALAVLELAGDEIAMLRAANVRAHEDALKANSRAVEWERKANSVEDASRLAAAEHAAVCRGYGMALKREDTAKARIAKLEAENAKLREAVELLSRAPVQRGRRG